MELALFAEVALVLEIGHHLRDSPRLEVVGEWKGVRDDFHELRDLLSS